MGKKLSKEDKWELMNQTQLLVFLLEGEQTIKDVYRHFKQMKMSKGEVQQRYKLLLSKKIIERHGDKLSIVPKIRQELLDIVEDEVRKVGTRIVEILTEAKN